MLADPQGDQTSQGNRRDARTESRPVRRRAFLYIMRNIMEEFLTELKRLYVELEGTYERNKPRVLQKVEEARQLLSGDGDLSGWDKELL